MTSICRSLYLHAGPVGYEESRRRRVPLPRPQPGRVLGEPAATLNESRAAAEEPAHAYA
jgi:hypothetical protein